MDWLFYDAMHYKPNGDVDRKKELDEKFSENYTVVKSTMLGVVYYAAIRNEKIGSITASVILTSSDKKGSGFNFGYKSMSEEMGPNESRCPKSILKLLTPTDDEYAIKWRERCWANYEQAKSPHAFKNLPVGTKVKWTVPCVGFNKFAKGEVVTLEKYQKKRCPASWVCWDKYIRINPKFVDMKDVEFLNYTEVA